MPNLTNAPLSFIARMAVHRHNQKVEARAWQRYLTDYSHMTKSTYKEYQPPKAESAKKVSKRSSDDIRAEAEKIRLAAKMKGATKNGDI